MQQSGQPVKKLTYEQKTNNIRIEVAWKLLSNERKQEIDMDNDTPKPGETGTPKAPENNPQTPAPVQGNASDSAGEAEKLRKELEQARMRENQLLNEKKAREEAEAARQAKELEQQNEFKTLYEQEKAKREAIESEKQAKEREAELAKAKAEVLADYSDEVKALAEEAGMTLTEPDEDAKATFKEKLDKIQNLVGTNGKITPDNPRIHNGQSELSQDETSFQDIISKRPGLAMMMSKR